MLKSTNPLVNLDMSKAARDASTSYLSEVDCFVSRNF
jgi:hypothetical protein